MNRYTAAFAGLLMLFPVAQAAGQDKTAPMATVPFIYEDSRLYVPVTIGRLGPRWFILDTGASPTIIDTAFAKDAALPAVGDELIKGAGAGSSHQSTTARTRLLIGGVPMTVDVPRISNLAGLLAATSGRVPAGIIGSQFFREHLVEIDFATHTLSLFAPGADRRAHFRQSVPLRFNESTPLTWAGMTLPDGRKVRAHVLLDLGAKSTFLIPEPFIDSEHLRAAFPNTITAALGAGVGGDTHYAFARARRLELNNQPSLGVDDPIVGLSVDGVLRSTWHQGLVGTDFLSRFKLGFDYAHARLLITPTKAPAPVFDMSGLFLVMNPDDPEGLLVREVMPGGPGARAGLLPGDKIVEIDGQPVSGIGLPGARAILKSGEGRAVRLGLVRTAVHQDVTLKLERLL